VFFLPLPTRVSRFNALRARGNRRLFFVLLPVSGGAAVHLLELAVISWIFFFILNPNLRTRNIFKLFFQRRPTRAYITISSSRDGFSHPAGKNRRVGARVRYA
jgi:hypothetical protein